MVLRGYSGYNTRWALLAKETAFGTGGAEELAPVAVTVLLGANDACLPDRSSAFHHVPPNEYKQNLHDIISFIKVSPLSPSRVSSLCLVYCAYTWGVVRRALKLKGPNDFQNTHGSRENDQPPRVLFVGP